MTTDEFIVLCDGIPSYQTHVRRGNADDLYREIAEVYVSTGTLNFWNELALRLQMRIAKGINDVNITQ